MKIKTTKKWFRHWVEKEAGSANCKRRAQPKVEREAVGFWKRTDERFSIFMRDWRDRAMCAGIARVSYFALFPIFSRIGTRLYLRHVAEAARAKRSDSEPRHSPNGKVCEPTGGEDVN